MSLSPVTIQRTTSLGFPEIATHVLQQKGPFDKAILRIRSLCKKLQTEDSLENKTFQVQRIWQELTGLRNTALQDRREVLALYKGINKEELEKLELFELDRGRDMERRVDMIMCETALYLAAELKNQRFTYPKENKTQFFAFYKEVLKIFTITLPQNMLETEWDYAKCLHEEGCFEESIAVIKKLPLPNNIKSVFDLITDFPTNEKLIGFFQFAEQVEIRQHLRFTSAEIYRPKTLSNVLSHPTIMEVFLKYVNPVTLMRLNTTCCKGVRESLSREYVETHAIKASDLRSFSLTSEPAVCCNLLPTAVAALWQNGLEYQYLGAELQQDIGLAKIALVSIVQKGITANFEKLIALFPVSITEKLEEYIRDIKANSEKSVIALPLQETNKKEPFLKMIARAFICKFPTDKDICRVMLQMYGELLEHVSTQLQNDPELALIAVRNHWFALKHVSKNLQDDATIVLAAVTQNKDALDYASARLKDTETVALAAVTRYGLWVKISTRLKDSEKIVMAAVSRDGSSLSLTSERLRNNETIVMTALARHGCALQSVSTRLKDSEIVVKTAVSQNGRALQYASERLRDAEEIVLAAVHQTCDAFQYASARFKDNEAFVLNVVTRSGIMLEHASVRLRDDEKIVLAAVSQNGQAFHDASKRLKDTEAIVMAAVKQNWSVLYSVSERLRDNEEIARVALSQNNYACHFISERLCKKLR